MKETTNALANLNTEVNRLQSDMQSLAKDIDESKKSQPGTTADSAGAARAQEDLSLLQTEVSFIRQEIGKLQEGRTIDRALNEKEDIKAAGEKGSFKEAVSSPWLVFVTFIVAIIGLFT